MDVDDFNIRVVLEETAELGDIDIHGAGLKLSLFHPDGAEGIFALKDIVGMLAEESKKPVLLRSELAAAFRTAEHLLHAVEVVLSDDETRLVAVALDGGATQDSLDAESKLLHGEGFRDIVVGSHLESFEDVVAQILCCEEDDGRLAIGGTDFTCEGETVFLRHHDVEDAKVETSAAESNEAGFTIYAEEGFIAFGLEIFAKKHAEVLVVFAE